MVAIFFISNFVSQSVALAATKVNINTANATELDSIPEVGQSTAAKIIAYRETSGPFVVIEDIMKVSGIKQTTFDKMKDFITVDTIEANPIDTKSLLSILITNPPTKTIYSVGDLLSISGLTIMGTYSDSSTSTEVISSADISGFDSSVVKIGQELTVTYGGKTTTFSVTISSGLPAVSSPATSSSNTIVVYSVHYIQEELSDYKEPENIFEISAGRARLVYVNSPVSLVAKFKVSKEINGNSCEYLWSFGDGMSQSGEKVEHIFKYAGEYNVVLNGACNDLKSVSRTIVKVVIPNLSIISNQDGSVEISNKGANEINLYNWKIVTLDQYYTFPIDTIISAGRSVIFPAEYLKVSVAGKEVFLIDTSGKSVAQVNIGDIVSANSGEVVSVVDFEKFVLEYRKITQINNLNLSANTAIIPIVLNNKSISTNTGVIPLTTTVLSAIMTATSADDQIDGTNSTAGMEPAVPEPTPRGFWSTVLHPIRSIKEAFYN